MPEITREYLRSQDLSETVPARFWAKVIKTDGCWGWSSVINKQGYPRIQRGTPTFRYMFASRVSWILNCGPIPNGMCVLHKCDNPICTRPDHLFLGTLKDNSEDMVRKGRSPRGEQQGLHKLTWKDVEDIRQRFSSAKRVRKMLADEFGVSTVTIWNIVRHKTWNPHKTT